MSSYLYCATPRGPEEHIRDGESCNICKDWMKQVEAKIVNGKVVVPVKAKPKVEAPKEPVVRAKKPAKPRRVEEPKRVRNAVAKCGTRSGYLRHLKLKETACQPCKDAQSEHGRAQRRKKGIRPLEINEREHGTPRGYRQHMARHETPCQPCKDAINKLRRDERAAKRAREAAEREDAA